MYTDRRRLIAVWGIAAVFLLNACWVVVIPAFTTLDGWAHLHTARLLWSGDTGGVYCPTPGLVVNQLGHWLLGALALVFGPLTGERLMLALLMCGIAFGTWRLVRAYGAGQGLVLLVLPFTCSFILALGFHNFLLALTGALLVVAWWARLVPLRWWHTAAFVAATVVLLLAHAGILPFLFLTIGVHEGFVAAGIVRRTDARFPASRWKPLAVFVLSCLPALGLVLFLGALGEPGTPEDPRPALRLRELLDLRVLTLYDRLAEEKFNYALRLLLIGALVLTVAARIAREGRAWWRPRPVDVLAVVAVLLSGAYCLLPDGLGFAGYLSVRLQLLAALMAIGWMAAQPLPAWQWAAPAVVVLLLHQARMRHLAAAVQGTEAARERIVEAAAQLPAGAYVLPVLFEDNWLLQHIYSLLGALRPVHLLKNYECGTGYFPLRWCPGLPAYLPRHADGHDTCLGWLDEHVASGAWPPIERIAVVGYATDSTRCDHAALHRVLERHYTPAFDNGYVRIHALRHTPAAGG